MSRTPDHLHIRPHPELDFSQQLFFGLVLDWLHRHPSIEFTNNNVRFILGRTADEVDETRHEHEREGQPDFASKLLELEATDIMVLFASVLRHEKLIEDIHLPSLANRVNGVSSRSDIFEQMQMMLHDMQEGPIQKKDVETFLAYWLSYWKHSPTQRQPDEVMSEAIHKNDNNYPAIYFSGRDPRTGRELTSQEKYQQYHHSCTCLRLIRNKMYRPEGLRSSDHVPFKDLILKFWDSEHAIAELQQRLASKGDFVLPNGDGGNDNFSIHHRTSGLLVARHIM